MGPDGKPLTDEEYAFLEENCNYGGFSPAGSCKCLFFFFKNKCQFLGNEALEDDEVLEDCEKFLQATAIRAAEKALEKMSFEDDEVEGITNNTYASVCCF